MQLGDDPPSDLEDDEKKLNLSNFLDALAPICMHEGTARQPTSFMEYTSLLFLFNAGYLGESLVYNGNFDPKESVNEFLMARDLDEEDTIGVFEDCAQSKPTNVLGTDYCHNKINGPDPMRRSGATSLFFPASRSRIFGIQSAKFRSSHHLPPVPRMASIHLRKSLMIARSTNTVDAEDSKERLTKFIAMHRGECIAVQYWLLPNALYEIALPSVDEATANAEVFKVAKKRLLKKEKKALKKGCKEK